MEACPFPASKRSGSATRRDPTSNHPWFIHRHLITYWTDRVLRPRKEFPLHSSLHGNTPIQTICMLAGVVRSVWSLMCPVVFKTATDKQDILKMMYHVCVLGTPAAVFSITRDNTDFRICLSRISSGDCSAEPRPEHSSKIKGKVHPRTGH